MFVSQVILENYKFWKPGDIVIIHAQTGSGKTFFVLNELLPFIKNEGKRMLYLSNRSALKAQVETSYNVALSNHITIMNYQRFERVPWGERNHSELAETIRSCEYWVLDEAHYFLADAGFNSDVLDCLTHIKAEQKNRVLIFMTATLEYLLLGLGQCGFFTTKPPTFIFDDGLDLAVPHYQCNGYLNDAGLVQQLSTVSALLTYKEVSDRDRRNYWLFLEAQKAYEENPENWVCKNQLQMAAQCKPHIPVEKFQNKFQEYNDYFESVKQENYYYYAGSGYTYVHPIYFKTPEQLCKQIQNTPPYEKWVIFVSSKKTGEHIRTCLENIKIDSVMITADTKRRKVKKADKQPKEYQAYQSIITDEMSPERVTISTAVLDNGVNLKDPQLKHMAIMELNPTSFLQMLGRKRITDLDKQFTVYLQSKDIGEIKAFFLQSTLKYVKFLVELRFVNKYTKQDLFDAKAKTNLINFSQSYQVNGNFRRPYYYFVKQISKVPYDIEKGTLNHTCRLFEPNPYMSVRLAYDFYRILALLEKFQNLPEDEQKVKKETLWIEHQLSWLGLEYDPTRWIDYGKHVKAKKIISKILTKNTDQPLSKNSQKKLKRAVSVAVTTSHPPLIVKIGQASIKKVNEALAELGYDKRVKSKNMSVQGKQRNYWIIVPVDEM